MDDPTSIANHKHIQVDDRAAPEPDLNLPTTYQDNEHDRDIPYTADASTKEHVDLELVRTKSIAETFSPFREVLFIGLLCSTQFVTQASFLGILNILYIIGSDLGITNPAVLAWLVAGYSLTVGTFILLSGRCGDVFGYKKMVIIGFAWFTLWNIIAGFSVYAKGNGGQVLIIVARVLGGIGPAIMLPNALGLLGATYNDGMKKNIIFSLFGAMAPLGAVVGATFAGLWSLVWWPWAFWTFAVALAGLTILSTLILPSVPLSPEVAKLSHQQKLGELDLLGASIGITAMILFNFAWNQAPNSGWQKVYVYVLLIISVLLFPVFFWHEMKVATKPLVPFEAFSMDVSFVLICITCGWASFGIWAYYFVQFLQTLRGLSPMLTAAQFAPHVVSGAMAAMTTGPALMRLGPGRVMLISMLAFLVGSILAATMPVHQTYWKHAFLCTIILPWGVDMSFPAGTLIMSSAMERRHQGMAASLVNTVVNYSISIGVGIAGTIESQVNNGRRSEAGELSGYRGVFYFGVGLSGLGVLTSLMFLGKTQMRERRNAKVGQAGKA